MSELAGAINQGQVSMVKELLGTVNVNEYRDPQFKRTYLHLAVSRGNLEIVKLLIATNINLDIQDSVGYTPLHLAILQNLKPIIGVLFEAGAKFMIPDNHQITAFQYAVSKNVTEFVIKFIQRLSTEKEFSLIFQMKLVKHYYTMQF